MSEENEVEAVIEYEDSPSGVFYSYANTVSIDWTPHDIRLRFAEIYQLPRARTPGKAVSKITEKASIAMAWSEVKSLHQLLGEAIGRYEAVNGELKPPNIV